MKTDHPIVSYIIPCFNQADFLYESISSVMLSYSGTKEILVIDDCSTNPSTSKKLDEVKKSFPEVQIIYHDTNKGLSATRNTGISLSTGEYIQLLDADDLLLPKKVDLQIEHFRLGNDLDISVTDYFYGDESISEFTIPEPSIGSFRLTLEDYLYKWERGLSIPIHCALFRKEVFTDNKFEESLTAKEDWVFWCKQALSGKKVSFLNIYNVVYRLHGAAMTKSKHAEMARMWVKATLLINDVIGIKDNSFINESLVWYECIYRKLGCKPTPMNGVAAHVSKTRNQEFEKLVESAIPRLVSKTKQSDNKLFSIIVPVYNHFEYLSKCFESIILQAFSDYEIICVDDNSTDPRVKEFLKCLESQLPNIVVKYNNQNKGISAAINQGIEAADGCYVAFLDCDDYLAPNALEEINNFTRKYPDVDYFFTDKIDIDENNTFIREAKYGGYDNIHPSESIEEDLLDGMVASHLKVIRRDKIIQAGGCDTSLEGVQDYDLALKILGHGVFKYFNKPLYYHRQHTSSITRTQTVSQFRKMNLARRNYCDREYKKKWNPSEAIGFFKDHFDSGNEYSQVKLAEFGISLFHADNVSLPILKEQVKNGHICILDARVKYQPGLKYFLREYNSFFDLILTNDSQLAISILGVLWDYNILWVP